MRPILHQPKNWGLDQAVSWNVKVYRKISNNGVLSHTFQLLHFLPQSLILFWKHFLSLGFFPYKHCWAVDTMASFTLPISSLSVHSQEGGL